MEYPQAVREAVVREALSGGRTQQEIARAHGVSKSSLQQWVRRARRQGGFSVREGKEKRSSEWSGEERFAAVMETHAMSEEEVGAWCRRRGVHGHELEQWRRDAMAANAGDAQYEEQRPAPGPTQRPKPLRSRSAWSQARPPMRGFGSAEDSHSAPDNAGGHATSPRSQPGQAYRRRSTSARSKGGCSPTRCRASTSSID